MTRIERLESFSKEAIMRGNSINYGKKFPPKADAFCHHHELRLQRLPVALDVLFWKSASGLAVVSFIIIIVLQLIWL